MLLGGASGRLWLAVVAVVVSIPGQILAQTPRQVVPGEYIIRLRAQQQAMARIDRDVEVSRSLGAFKLVRKTAALRLSGREPEFVDEDPADRTCADLIASGAAELCEPNYRVDAYATPDDASFSALWGMAAIDAMRAWDVSTGSAEVVVAVLDTGIDYRHPDLAANVWINPGEIAGNGIDDDANGYIDDLHGINTLAHSGDPLDDNGHGSHVSGTIGAVGNNALGVTGINWNVRIIGLKFLGSSGSGSIAGAVEAINYLILLKSRGANVVFTNNSWGGGSYSSALRDVMAQARAAGIFFVAAAGNEGNDNDASPSYPASFDLDNIISVAAVDRDQRLASFSNFGAQAVDIAAPGVSILSTTLQGGYSSWSGTSMATPHVTGALALLQAANPTLSAEDMLKRLYDSGVPLQQLQGLVRTGRMLNVGRMLHNETSPIVLPSPDPGSCSYRIETIPNNPDTSADHGQQILKEVDEYAFQTVTLPFIFPFDGAQFSQVVISPNGLIYLGTEVPAGMDYRNGSYAPLMSIAALHTDIVSNVRVAKTSNAVTIFWSGHLYGSADAGQVDVRLALGASGDIREWISFSSPQIESMIQKAATIGLTGSTAQRSATYAVNSALIHSGVALQYIPSCSGGGDGGIPVAVSKLSLWGLDQSGSLTKSLTPKRKFRMKVRTASTGMSSAAVLDFSFGRRACPLGGKAIQLAPGKSLRVSGRLPSVLSYFRWFSASVQGMTARRRVTPEINAKFMKRKRLSASALSRACSSLTRSLRVR